MPHIQPIFQDQNSPIESLLSQADKLSWQPAAEEVGLIQVAQAIEGENWAPQLNPYEEWKSEKTSDEPTEYDPRNTRAGKWGKIKCIDDSERERLVAIGLENARKVAEERERKKHEAEEKLGHEVNLSVVYGVKEGSDGYVLSKLDLRQYAKFAGVEEGLVVVLPSHIGGVPLTRVEAEAFSRYNVRGIGVRLLVLPDTVQFVEAGAFSYLAAENIYIGSGCVQLGDQPLEKRILKPAIERRAFYISPKNPKWSSINGSIVSKDGGNLVFFAPPYEKHMSIPEGVARIGQNAFAEWDTVPEMVKCGYSLQRCASKLWDGALWLCPQDAPMFEILKGRNVQTASHDAVLEGRCWYDFDDDGAVLVAGPPAPPTASQAFVASLHAAKDDSSDSSADADDSDALNIPRSVSGRPLTRVAPLALVDATETLIFPEGLKAIGHDNACKKTKHLSLPNSLRRIEAHCFGSRQLDAVTSVPAGVYSIGSGCFEYGIVRLEHTGTIVHISANQLLNCFIERSDEEIAALAGACPESYVPFDYAKYDELLCEGRSLPDRLGALVHRIGVPFQLGEKARKNIVGQLKDNAEEAMAYVARQGDLETVAKLIDAGFIDESTFERQIELLRRCNRTDCVMLLMERHREKNAASSKSVKSRFSL